MTQAVREFHEKFGLDVHSTPPLRPDPDLLRLRGRLIAEEFGEVMAELESLVAATRHRSTNDVQEIYAKLLKELVDLYYVTAGCAVALGLPFDEGLAEVHRSNMSKLGEDGQPIRRDDGKVLKGPNYSPASMEPLLPGIVEHV